MVVAALGLAVGLLALAWRWSVRSIDGSMRVAVVAVLAVTAAAFNVVVPIPSIEVTTTVTLCAAAALGLRVGAMTGIVAVLASSIAGGVGVWTVWQAVGVLVVAGIGWMARSAIGSGAAQALHARVVLVLASVVGAAAWDVVTTIGSAASLGSAGGVSQPGGVLGLLLLGAAFTAVHVAWCAVFTALAGPSLLHALDRARLRLDGGVTTIGSSTG